MQQVVARRDDNWKKLQQYILDEREVADLRGPGNIRMWGEDREYTWFIRDGYFIRSPVKFNGVTISEDERRKAEDEYLQRSQRRDARAAAREGTRRKATTPDQRRRPHPPDAPAAVRLVGVLPAVQVRRRPVRARRPRAVRGPRRAARRVLPDEAVRGQAGRAAGGAPATRDSKQNRQEAELRRVMNKVALVTLWIEPASHQIVKYTFDNINFDFLPGQWLVHVDTAKASMTMSQPFTDVWLPRGIEVNVGLTLATGEVSFRSTVSYHDYREATVTSKVGIPGAPAGPSQALTCWLRC